MKKGDDYPNRAYANKRDWLRDVRKRWSAFKKSRHPYHGGVMSGSIYYPPEVYEWLKKTVVEARRMDKIMRQYYKNS